jgi:hypothetical protein
MELLKASSDSGPQTSSITQHTAHVLRSRHLMGSVAPSADVLLSCFAAFTLAVAYVSTYRRRRHWERRLRYWQGRLHARIDVLRMLIAEGRDVQRACLTERDPMSTHQAFVDRCDAALREHFGAFCATRI